jgi:hypothetical protein
MGAGFCPIDPLDCLVTFDADIVCETSSNRLSTVEYPIGCSTQVDEFMVMLE